MLPRKLIIDHGLDVMECLLLRNPEQEIIDAVNVVCFLGPFLNESFQKIEELRKQKNILSSSFSKADIKEKDLIKEKVSVINIELNLFEIEMKATERMIKECEICIPNIPAEDSPLSFHSKEDQEWKCLLLRRVHRLMKEYNS